MAIIIAYDLDRLFRSERPPQGDIAYTRGEAARILLTASSHSGIQDDDRAYLVRLVTSRAGLASQRPAAYELPRQSDDFRVADGQHFPLWGPPPCSEPHCLVCILGVVADAREERSVLIPGPRAGGTSAGSSGRTFA